MSRFLTATVLSMICMSCANEELYKNLVREIRDLTVVEDATVIQDLTPKPKCFEWKEDFLPLRDKGVVASYRVNTDETLWSLGYADGNYTYLNTYGAEFCQLKPDPSNFNVKNLLKIVTAQGSSTEFQPEAVGLFKRASKRAISDAVLKITYYAPTLSSTVSSSANISVALLDEELNPVLPIETDKLWTISGVSYTEKVVSFTFSNIRKRIIGLKLRYESKNTANVSETLCVRITSLVLSEEMDCLSS